jgi:DNA-binding XRE family transcriptional regulator
MKSEDSVSVDQRLTKIGNHVRKLRKEKTDLNYIDFAAKIGMNRKTYYKVERGQEEYYLSTLIRIISYYEEITLESFFREIGL